MEFAAPAYLAFFAVAVPLAALLLERRERRRRRELADFGEAPLLERSSSLPDRRGAAWRDALAVLALGLALLALARPQLGRVTAPLARTGSDVLFVLDLSRSMNVQDATPSRLEAGRAAIQAILAGSPGDRVGLVVFAGSAFLQLPFTLDRSAFEFFLRAASTEDLADTGSDLGAALFTAATAFDRDVAPGYRAAVLVSDGENLEGSLGDAVAMLRHAGVRVFTVGVGTPEGGPVPTPESLRPAIVAGSAANGQPPAAGAGSPVPDGPAASGAPPSPGEATGLPPAPAYRRDASGAVVVSRLREQTLERIAEETGGSYVRYGGGPEIQRIVDDLSRVRKRRVSARSLARLAERYQWPLVLALAALVVEALVHERTAPRPGAPARPAGPGSDGESARLAAGRSPAGPGRSPAPGRMRSMTGGAAT